MVAQDSSTTTTDASATGAVKHDRDESEEEVAKESTEVKKPKLDESKEEEKQEEKKEDKQPQELPHAAGEGDSKLADSEQDSGKQIDTYVQKDANDTKDASASDDSKQFEKDQLQPLSQGDKDEKDEKDKKANGNEKPEQHEIQDQQQDQQKDSSINKDSSTEQLEQQQGKLEAETNINDPDFNELKQDTEKDTTVKVNPDGTIDTSRMVPAPKPEIKIEENVENALPVHQKQYLLKSLKSIKRLKDAAPFLQPVDTIKLQIPFYYNFIPKPMDLSLIEKKLNSNSYKIPQDVHDDFNLMINNCIKFNGDKSGIARMGKNIQASFEKLLLNVPQRHLNTASETDGRHKRKQSLVVAGNGVPKIRRDNSSGRPKREIHPPKPKDMPYDIRPRNKKLLTDLRFAGQVLKELTSKKHESYSYPFMEPVDPVALDCPTYFDYVKNPMDLSTIQNKLQNNQYNALEEFHDDVKLVFHNCYIFNPEGSPVNVMGHKLEAVFDKKYQEKPVHAPTPPPASAGKNSQGGNGDGDNDDDEEEEDEEVDESEIVDIEQSIMNNQAIQFLEAQIERMKEDLEKMKREEYEKAKKRAIKQKKKKNTQKKKSAAAANKRRKSAAAASAGAGADQDNDDQIELTFDMKKELSEKIADLSEKKLQHVMKIINESVPDLQKDGEDEIELDMDMLDDATLLKLYNYVVSKNSLLTIKKGKGGGRGGGRGGTGGAGGASRNGSANSANGSNGNGSDGKGGGKRKPANRKTNDRDEKIDMLKQRLEEYDKENANFVNNNNGNNGTNNLANNSDSSDDDDDDDDESESSEEE